MSGHSTNPKASRRKQLIEFNGETMSLTGWAARVGITRYALGSRLRAGWSLERALTEKKSRAGSGGKTCAGASPERHVWLAMRSRCNKPNNPAFCNYGGRGIKVCDRWQDSFENFLADMGNRPSPKHSIDRFPDGDGNYEPGNCRWATTSEQAATRRTTRLITVDGITLPISHWAQQAGINYQTICKRLESGWSESDAVTTPLSKAKSHKRGQ